MATSWFLEIVTLAGVEPGFSLLFGLQQISYVGCCWARYTSRVDARHLKISNQRRASMPLNWCVYRISRSQNIKIAGKRRLDL